MNASVSHFPPVSDAPLTIWCNAAFPDRALSRLREGVGSHRLIFPSHLQASNLAAGDEDPHLAEADIALGQPSPSQIAKLPKLRWVHLTSAGYTRYDTDALRQAFQSRGAALTNSSAVYEEPCAEHVLAMMAAVARQLPAALLEQDNDRAWRAAEHRIRSRPLRGQTAILYGYGSIARRLAEILAPFHMKLIGVRRSPRGGEPIRIVTPDDADMFLAEADHVVNILPANPASEGFFDAMRFARMKRGAVFYNIGRGTTVKQDALREALRGGRLSAAYLDVTDPEPLPKDHPLWSTPNCFITPHTAGGHDEEFENLVGHFLENLDRFTSSQTLKDRVY